MSKILVIGGVAAGTKAAAKLKRLDRTADITVVTMSEDISYAGCGLPYYVGGMIETREELIVNTPQKYTGLTGVKVLTSRKVCSLDAAEKTAVAENTVTGEKESFGFDKCVIAVGASPVIPDIKGADMEGVFTVRTPDDAENIRSYAKRESVRKAVVVGGGFIGLEMAENLMSQGISVTVIDLATQLLPNVFDPEMAGYIRKHLQAKGVRVFTSVNAEEIQGESKPTAVKTDSGLLAADMVIFSAGIKPNTDFLDGSGIEMDRGRILTDTQGRTNLADIYAAGDCAMVSNRITGKPQWSPMGSTANIAARNLACGICGQEVCYEGVLGTGIAKLPELNCGRTGLTEQQAKDAGFDAVSVIAVTDDKAHYYEDSSFFVTKLIADRGGKLLGAQVIGSGAVDKMTDIAATAISMKAELAQLEHLDLAYAPPFSTAIHPFVQAVYVLENKLSGAIKTMSPADYLNGKAKNYTVIDASPEPQIPNAIHVDISQADGGIKGVEKDEKLLLVCNRGKRGYFLQNRLAAAGYTDTLVLEGGLTFNDVKAQRRGAGVSPEEVTRLKALGCLWDKRTADRFNVRVITVNGKITSAQHIAIAEAAQKFGTGEVTMTTRLTLEIQGVPYENVEPLREFLSGYDLKTGGTGSKVRPVVSCKGTTCQYGLIDTFELSEEIHKRFFEGYNNVKLPHKFKIAVGGCPNNCVKPDLNDLGIVGQKVPSLNLEKCRGCKVCQVEKICPIHVSEVKDGKLAVDLERCNHCGRCVGKCPFHVTDEFVSGYRIYLGGRWGKQIAHGKPLSKIFTDKDEVLNVVEKAILLFREQGITGERFADTVARLGFENVEAQLLSDELLDRKQENLSAKKHMKGGATC